MISPAEERIRLKAEAALRRTFPTARVIHELVVKQGSCRIDIAAVTESRIVLIEIKSEKDVLTRLERQIGQARQVADGVLVVTTEKHIDKVREVAGWLNSCLEDEIVETIERYVMRQILSASTNAPARLDMLWAQELRAITGSGKKSNRTRDIVSAADGFTGAEVRRQVCAALRARIFPRADEPILSDLFPYPTAFRS